MVTQHVVCFGSFILACRNLSKYDWILCLSSHSATRTFSASRSSRHAVPLCSIMILNPWAARPRVGELPLLLDAHLVLRVRRESIIRDREVVVQLGLFLACQIIHPFDKACRHMMMTGMTHIASLPQVPLAASVESHCAMVSVIFDPCISRSSHRDF